MLSRIIYCILIAIKESLSYFVFLCPSPIQDINSHAPVFNMTSYVGEVEENDASKPLLVTVAAYEKDRDGKTKPITFGFLVNVDNKFTINPLSVR